MRRGLEGLGGHVLKNVGKGSLLDVFENDSEGNFHDFPVWFMAGL